MTEAQLLGVERNALGTDEAVWFWYRLGYTTSLLFHCVYDTDVCDAARGACLHTGC